MKLTKQLLKAFLFIFVLTACNSPKAVDSDKDGITDDKDACPDIAGKAPSGCPSEKQIENIKFFLETSASMAGYFKGSTEFKTITANFLTKIDNQVAFKRKPLKINLIAENIAPFTRTTNDFIRELATTRIADKKSSQMHLIFDQVANSLGPNDIGIFESDCILSFPDDDIKKNSEINKTDAESVLKPFINGTFSKIRRNNFSVSVYCFKSNFNGTYYTYQNGKIPINGLVKRPFYVWIIGDKDLVSKFNKQILSFEGFKPEMQLDYGSFNKAISNYNLLFKTEKSGTWKCEQNTVADVEISKTKPVRFGISVNLDAVPAYAKTPTYLKKNLAATGSNGKFSIINVQPVNSTTISKAQPREQVYLQQATHIITLSMDEMYGSNATINLILPLNYDLSYKNWSTMDDKSLVQLNGKTFAFEHLVNGVREAYQSNDANYINLTINLKK